jgi:hypothetical protein
MAAAEMRFALVPFPQRPLRLLGGEITEFKPIFRSFYGYLGCSEKSQFTRFAAGLEFVAIYAEYRKMMNLVNPGGANSHLDALKWPGFYINPDGSRNVEQCAMPNSTGISDPSNSVIPLTLDEAQRKYRYDSSAETKLFGCLLYIADETFQRGACKYITSPNELLQASSSSQIYADLQKNHGWIMPTEHQTSEVWRDDRVLPPGLRPECIQDYGEHVCKRWNRIWHCLQMVDYYNTTSKRDLMWVIGQNKDFDKPDWWRTQPTEAEWDVCDTAGMIRAALSRFKTKRTPTRQLECIWRLANDQDELRGYLHFSKHPEYAKQLQEEQVVLSPCTFRDVDEWTSYLGQILKFKELQVNILEVKMLLFDANGWNVLEERPIFNDNESWTDDGIEEAFDVAYATKAEFAVMLIPGKSPKPIKVKSLMPRDMDSFWDIDEESGLLLDK